MFLLPQSRVCELLLKENINPLTKIWKWVAAPYFNSISALIHASNASIKRNPYNSNYYNTKDNGNNINQNAEEKLGLFTR